MTKSQNHRITSVREALEYVEADFDYDDEGEIVAVKVKCRGCGVTAEFKVCKEPIRSDGDQPIETWLDFANRHQVCTEIKERM